MNVGNASEAFLLLDGDRQDAFGLVVLDINLDQVVAIESDFDEVARFHFTTDGITTLRAADDDFSATDRIGAEFGKKLPLLHRFLEDIVRRGEHPVADEDVSGKLGAEKLGGNDFVFDHEGPRFDHHVIVIGPGWPDGQLFRDSQGTDFKGIELLLGAEHEQDRQGNKAAHDRGNDRIRDFVEHENTPGKE